MGKTQPRTILISLITLGIAILVAAWYVISLQYLEKTEITIIGLPFDPTTIESIKASTEVKIANPNRFNITYIPPFESDGENITLNQNLQIPEELFEETVTEGLFLQELVEKNPRLAYEYTVARQSDLNSLQWESFALYVDENLIDAIQNISQNFTKYAKKYEESYQKAEVTFRENSIPNQSISITLLNQEIHNIGIAPTPYTLRTSMVKEKLRNSGRLPGESGPVNLLGLEYSSARPQVDKFNEAYQDVDCNDRSDAYGFLIDGGTPYSRCEYEQTQELDIKIVYFKEFNEEEDDPTGSIEESEQIIRRFLQANFKNLSISEWKEAAYGRDITSLKTSDPRIVFTVLIDEEVRNTPAFELFTTQGILEQFQDDKYLLNLPQILQ